MKSAGGDPVAQTTGGAVVGQETDTIRLFLSVPYAAPPVGERRFAAPQPVDSWGGMRDARVAGATAPQNAPKRFAGLDMVAVVGNGWVKGSDYLTLNIWTPADARNRPVMVWIHGGGLVIGSKDASVYDGSAFARSGVICVAINYRLGVEGFVPIAGAPTNLGLRDMLFALAWVRDNIEAFGGDPHNVTLFGESGGAMAVASLVTSPLAKGLFRRAIVQSGHGSATYPLTIAGRVTARLARTLKVTPDREGFSRTSEDACVSALAKAARPGAVDLRDERGVDPGFGLARAGIVHGDDVLPAAPGELLAAGAGTDVDVLISTTAEEANFWFKPTRLDRLLPGFAARWMVRNGHPDPRAVLTAYGAGRGARSGEAMTRALTALAFRGPARLYAEMHRGPTHVLEFDWRSPASRGRLGACHGLDLPFVFDTLPTVTGPRGMVGVSPPRHLAKRAHELWLRFATDGFLPWQAFDRGSRQVYRLTRGNAQYEPVMPAAAFW